LDGNEGERMRTDIVLDPEVLELLRELDQQKSGAFSEFVRMFISEAPDLVKKIEAAYLETNVDTLSQSAHYLRSACLALGAGQLADTCHRIEFLKREQIQPENIDQALDELRHRVRDALYALLGQVPKI
jgi:HPt (histidine-containing phosphotransfer) domain-containing protein